MNRQLASSPTQTGHLDSGSSNRSAATLREVRPSTGKPIMLALAVSCAIGLLLSPTRCLAEACLDPKPIEFRQGEFSFSPGPLWESHLTDPRQPIFKGSFGPSTPLTLSRAQVPFVLDIMAGKEFHFLRGGWRYHCVDGESHELQWDMAILLRTRLFSDINALQVLSLENSYGLSLRGLWALPSPVGILGVNRLGVRFTAFYERANTIRENRLILAGEIPLIHVASYQWEGQLNLARDLWGTNGYGLARLTLGSTGLLCLEKGYFTQLDAPGWDCNNSARLPSEQRVGHGISPEPFLAVEAAHPSWRLRMGHQPLPPMFFSLDIRYRILFDYSHMNVVDPSQTQTPDDEERRQLSLSLVLGLWDGATSFRSRGSVIGYFFFYRGVGQGTMQNDPRFMLAGFGLAFN